MSKGMISNFEVGDDYLIDFYDDFVCAKEFSTPISEVEAWTVEKMEQAKTTLKVIKNIEGGK